MEQQSSAHYPTYEESIQIGGIYEHYKGKHYRVLMLVWACESNELERWVVYQALYDIPELGEETIFTRSLHKFLEKITIDGKTINRFQYIG